MCIRDRVGSAPKRECSLVLVRSRSGSCFSHGPQDILVPGFIGDVDADGYVFTEKSSGLYYAVGVGMRPSDASLDGSQLHRV